MEETEHEEASEVFDQGCWNGEDDEDEHCDGVDRTSTHDGNLAEWGKNQRSYAIGEDVEGERERSVGWGDAELLDNAAFARGVNCRAGIDGECVGADDHGYEAALAIGPILGVCCIVRCVPVD